MHNSPTLATDVVMRLDSPELNDNSLIWSLLSRQIGPLYGLLRSLAINKKFEGSAAKGSCPGGSTRPRIHLNPPLYGLHVTAYLIVVHMSISLWSVQ